MWLLQQILEMWGILFLGWIALMVLGHILNGIGGILGGILGGIFGWIGGIFSWIFKDGIFLGVLKIGLIALGCAIIRILFTTNVGYFVFWVAFIGFIGAVIYMIFSDTSEPLPQEDTIKEFRKEWRLDKIHYSVSFKDYLKKECSKKTYEEYIEHEEEREKELKYRERRHIRVIHLPGGGYNPKTGMHRKGEKEETTRID